MFTTASQFFLEIIVNGRSATEYFYHDEHFVEGIIGREFTLHVGISG